MKTVRFTEVIRKSGPPEVYLLLMQPEKDVHFKAALKANRVMTVHTGTGSKTDHGSVGYEAGHDAEILLFPRSLKTFAGKTVVGIKYDLLREEIEKHPAPKKRPLARKPKSGRDR